MGHVPDNKLIGLDWNDIFTEGLRSRVVICIARHNTNTAARCLSITLCYCGKMAKHDAELFLRQTTLSIILAVKFQSA